MDLVLSKAPVVNILVRKHTRDFIDLGFGADGGETDCDRCVHPRCKIATSHTTRREPPLSATLLLAPVVSADSVVDDHGF